MKIRVLALIVAISTMAGLTAFGQATVLFQHLGSTNPTNEGFDLLPDNASLTPVSDSGVNAWGIYLSSKTTAQYSRTLTSEEQSALATGWALSLTLRILPPFSQTPHGIYAWFSSGIEGYRFIFGAQPNGDPIVRLNDAQYDLNGLGAGYHNYQLRFDSLTDSTTFWVDGTQMAGELTGWATPVALVLWGGVQNPLDSVNANWHEVTLMVIPEPSAAGLFALSALVFAARRFYRRHGTL